MSLKLLSGSTVVDAVIVPCFVYYNSRLQAFLACSEGTAQGVAAHDGSTYYQLEGQEAFGVDGYSTVSAVTISESEAAAIVEALDAGRPTPDPEPTEDDGSLELVRSACISRMSAACNSEIVSGVDVVFSDGNSYHFSLKIEDQLNIISLHGMISAGAQSVPYHADGQECQFFSAEDFTALVTAATSWKVYQESYFNSLRCYMNSMQTTVQLLACTYGMEIPAEYQTEVLKQIISQQGGGET